jgi:hypothetical protein
MLGHERIAVHDQSSGGRRGQMIKELLMAVILKKILRDYIIATFNLRLAKVT